VQLAGVPRYIGRSQLQNVSRRPRTPSWPRAWNTRCCAGP